MKLLIVESPHKSETIGHFLGSDYKVLASKGHIRDLASTGKMGLGVDLDDGFKPTYKISPDKVQTVKELKAAVSKADVVYLATDPDREGEAISWHLAQVLGLDVEKTPRLEFHEITKNAILKALDNPRTIDMKLVESQEARRIIDRLMGYRLSNLLQRRIKSRSAGRVQSVVLKFIVDKEREIQAFIPQEYWTIAGDFLSGKNTLHADLAFHLGKPIKIASEQEALDIVSQLPDSFTVSNIKSNITKKEPKPPFITSTLQQEAFAQLHFSTKKTAALAQRLYEGKEIDGALTGLITYMRTDSTRLAQEFIDAAHQHILISYGKEYLGNAHMQKSNKNVQDAHEAIRPTDITFTPERVKAFLTKDELKLYTLIYDRAVSSLMAAKQDQITTLTLSGNDFDFQTSSTKNVFPGYYAIYGKYEEDGKDVEKLPKDIKVGDAVSVKEITKTQHFTKAPNRYNEGRVVKLMQENGIGRPSTYASTISTLLDRDYVESQKGSLIPTEQGELTVDKLEEYFPKYMDASYTAGMEASLDSIADGKTDRIKLLSDFWDEFTKYYDAAKEHMEKLQPKVVEGRVCPKCGKPLVYRKGRYGEFVGCSDYPNCNYIEKEQPDVIPDRVCPRCGGQLVKRKGKRGEFVGCSNYPSCTYMEDLQGNPLGTEKKPVEIPADAPLCPQCHVGHLIEKKSRWGKTFIGCSNYPACHYIQKDGNAPKKTGRKKKQ